MAANVPEYLQKLIEFWDRKDTAGFYELDNLVLEIVATEKKALLEEVFKHMNEVDKTLDGDSSEHKTLVRLADKLKELE